MPFERLLLTRGEKAVLWFTLAYVAGFTAWFLARGNFEFIIYVATMAILIGLVGRQPAPRRLSDADARRALALGPRPYGRRRRSRRRGVLYSLPLVPLVGTGEMTILKYDQVVHAYGFGVTAWLLWHLLAHHYPVLRGSWTIYVYPALAAMGLGAVNEIIEFSAVLMVPETNVGGYFNTLLDLCFNALGAILAMVVVARIEAARRT